MVVQWLTCLLVLLTTDQCSGVIWKKTYRLVSKESSLTRLALVYSFSVK